MLTINDLGSPVAAFLAAAGLNAYRLRLNPTAEVTPYPVMFTNAFTDNGNPQPRTGTGEQTWQYQALVPTPEMERLAGLAGIPVDTLLLPGSQWQVREPGRDWVDVRIVRDPVTNGANWVLTLQIPGTI